MIAGIEAFRVLEYIIQSLSNEITTKKPQIWSSLMASTTIASIWSPSETTIQTPPPQSLEDTNRTNHNESDQSETTIGRSDGSFDYVTEIKIFEKEYRVGDTKMFKQSTSPNIIRTGWFLTKSFITNRWTRTCRESNICC